MANSIFRILKKVICAMLGLVVVQHVSAFSVTGPAQSWQTPTLNYLTRYWYNYIELGAPQELNVGARLNVPIITYGFDSTFLSFFGSQGVAAVDAAMTKLNGLPSASSAKLSKFLTADNQAVNYSAQAMGLLDMKSTVMSLMLEHMGLMGETHVWDLRVRALPSGAAACAYDYVVLNRNYDPVTYDPTAYVNGVLYSYYILDGCSIGVDVADAIEFPADLSAGANFTFTAVATLQSLQPGGFYLGVTRDDMGGIAYLLSSHNYAYESLDSNSVVSGGSALSTWSPVNTNITSFGTNSGFQGLFGGVEKITYVKVAYDSLLGQAFVPRTYSFTMPYVTNGTLQTLRVSRTVTQPDILFTAADLLTGPATYPIVNEQYSRGFTFINSGTVSLGGGPSAAVISAQELVTFNNMTPIYYNYSPNFMDELTSSEALIWGSFDGSTNAPVVFPTGTSLRGIEQQVLSGGSTVPSGTWNPISFLNSNTITTGTTTVSTNGL